MSQKSFPDCNEQKLSTNIKKSQSLFAVPDIKHLDMSEGFQQKSGIYGLMENTATQARNRCSQ